MKNAYRIAAICMLIMVVLAGYNFISDMRDPRKLSPERVVIEPPPQVESDAISQKLSLSNPIKRVIKDNRFLSSTVEPSYLNEDMTVFAYELIEGTTASRYIGMIKHHENIVKTIYTAPEHRSISTLVGVKDELYWVEREPLPDGEIHWEIKSLQLAANKVLLVESGSVSGGYEPPSLSTDGERITWIKRNIHRHETVSSVIVYEPLLREIKWIAEVSLKEIAADEEGRHMIMQRPVSDGILVLESVHQRTGDSGKDTIYQVVHYPYDRTKTTRVLHEGAGVIDFIADDNWFVWSEPGRIYAVDRKTLVIKQRYEADDSRLTLDSLFLCGDQLYFRYSVYQIRAMNLLNGTIQAHSPHRSITSKLFQGEGYLGFSIMDATQSVGEAAIYMMKIIEH